MRLAALLLVLAACAPKPEPYAPVKKRLCADCWTAKLPFDVPRHGLALGISGYRLSSATWIVVDLDREALNRLSTRFDRQSNTVNLLSRKEEPLGGRKGRLVAVANTLWASDLPASGTGEAEVRWEVYLFDGKDVRHDSGPGSPTGVAEELFSIAR